MTNLSTNLLDKETKYFESNKEDLLKKYAGQFVTIKDNKVLGSYSNEKDAYSEGVQKFGQEPFLIKLVTKEESNADIPALTIGVINASL